MRFVDSPPLIHTRSWMWFDFLLWNPAQLWNSFFFFSPASALLAFSLDGRLNVDQYISDGTDFSGRAPAERFKKRWKTNEKSHVLLKNQQEQYSKISWQVDTIQCFCPDLFANQPFLSGHALVWTPFCQDIPCKWPFLSCDSWCSIQQLQVGQEAESFAYSQLPPRVASRLSASSWSI